MTVSNHRVAVGTEWKNVWKMFSKAKHIERASQILTSIIRSGQKNFMYNHTLNIWWERKESELPAVGVELKEQ